jgi:hypothetical protein
LIRLCDTDIDTIVHTNTKLTLVCTYVHPKPYTWARKNMALHFEVQDRMISTQCVAPERNATNILVIKAHFGTNFLALSSTKSFRIKKTCWSRWPCPTCDGLYMDKLWLPQHTALSKVHYTCQTLFNWPLGGIFCLFLPHTLRLSNWSAEVCNL